MENEDGKTADRLDENILECIYRKMPQMFFLSDLEGNLLRWNDSLKSVTGFSDDELSGMNALEVVDEEDREAAVGWITEGLRTGSMPPREFHMLLKNGKRLPVEWFGMVVSDAGGGPLGFCGIGKGVSGKTSSEAILIGDLPITDKALNCLEDVLVVNNLRGGLVYWNRRLEEVSGYSRQEVSEMSILDFFRPDQGQLIAGGITKVLQNGQHKLDLTVVTNSGEEIPYEVAATRLDDEEGSPVGIVSVGRDISFRKALETELLRERSFTSQALDSQTDIFTILDLEGNFLRWNRRMSEVSGYTDEEIRDMSIADFLAPGELEPVMEGFRAVLEHEANTMEARAVTRDGRELVFEFSGTLMRDEDGSPTGIVGIGRDITERRSQLEELERINAELEGYAHIVSHDLRGILSSCILSIDMLKELLLEIEDGEAAEEGMEIARTLDAHAQRAFDHVEEVLSLAQAGQVPETVEEIDIGLVVDTVIRDNQGLIHQSGARIRVDPDLGSVRGNRTQMEQLFNNLVGNALKHCDAETPEITVTFLGETEAGSSRYLVRDNGSGIPKEIIGSIFLPFFRGKAGDKGIGLSIVDKIVKTYRGEVRAYNDQGACFEVSIHDLSG